MRAQAGGCSIGLAAVALVIFGCSPPPPPPPAPKTEPPPPAAAAPEEIPKEAVASGKDCAKAEAQCGGGVCSVVIDNTCEQPVTCNLFVVTVCQEQTDLVQVKARTRETFAARKKDTVSITANCQAGRIVSTKLQQLECK